MKELTLRQKVEAELKQAKQEKYDLVQRLDLVEPRIVAYLKVLKFIEEWEQEAQKTAKALQGGLGLRGSSSSL